jgi:hypothetical protein
MKEINWKTIEHHHETEKSSDWFWILGIIALGSAILSVFFGNILFAIVILLAAFTMILHVHTDHEEIDVSVYKKGVRINKTLYPWTTLDSFWIVEDDDMENIPNQILIKSQKPLLPLIIIPMPDEVDPEELKDYMLGYIDEEEITEPLSHRLMEYLGF